MCWSFVLTENYGTEKSNKKLGRAAERYVYTLNVCNCCDVGGFVVCVGFFLHVQNARAEYCGWGREGVVVCVYSRYLTNLENL